MEVCLICLDSAGDNAVKCLHGCHGFCTICFTKYVSVECDCLKSRLTAQIKCPFVTRGQCSSPAFTDEFIAKHVDSATRKKYYNVKDQYQTFRPAPKTVIEYRIEVIELLNPACPHCYTTFIDFEGCCALTCRVCSCQFCAYCLQKPPQNVHDHINICEYHDLENWRRGQLRRAKDRIVALLKPLQMKERQQVLEFCHGYFNDLPIDVKSMFQALDVQFLGARNSH